MPRKWGYGVGGGPKEGALFSFDHIFCHSLLLVLLWWNIREWMKSRRRARTIIPHGQRDRNVVLNIAPEASGSGCGRGGGGKVGECSCKGGGGLD